MASLTTPVTGISNTPTPVAGLPTTFGNGTGVTGTTGTAGAAGTGGTTGTNGTQTLGQSQFLQLLTQQLQNQDPLSPVSSTDFIAQIAQFSTLQGINTLNTTFGQVLQLQQITQGVNLIGKNVHYTPTGSTQQQTGVVTSVSTENGNIVLQVGSAQVPLSQVNTVTSA